MVTEDRFATVRNFIVDQTGVRASKVAADARLTEDLGIAADDLVELMDTFFATFAIDPGEYTHDTYAGDEGVAFFSFGRRAKSVQPLSVSALVTALEQGRWSA